MEQRRDDDAVARVGLDEHSEAGGWPRQEVLDEESGPPLQHLVQLGEPSAPGPDVNVTMRLRAFPSNGFGTEEGQVIHERKSGEQSVISQAFNVAEGPVLDLAARWRHGDRGHVRESAQARSLASCGLDRRTETWRAAHDRVDRPTGPLNRRHRPVHDVHLDTFPEGSDRPSALDARLQPDGARGTNGRSQPPEGSIYSSPSLSSAPPEATDASTASIISIAAMPSSTSALTGASSRALAANASSCRRYGSP